MALADLFPDEDFRLRLTLRRGEPAEFFRPQDASGAVLAERKRWLASDPARYAALQPKGEPLLREFAALCADWRVAEAEDVVVLGGALEPDFLLLAPDESGEFRLRGGALCFPTGWALDEKLGETMEFIHGVVPGLNEAIGAQIHQFMARLKPGGTFLRDNWGIAATPELNLHPARRLAGPAASAAMEGLWLRVEHQSLLALTRNRGIVFGIRIALHRLDRAILDPAVRLGLKWALASMSEEMAAYKRLDGIRDELLRQL